MGRAESYSAKGDHDHAIADYSDALEIGPGDAVVYRKRADAFRLKGALDKAIIDYSKAIELDSKDALAYYFRGVSYLAKKTVIAPSPISPKPSRSIQKILTHISRVHGASTPKVIAITVRPTSTKLFRSTQNTQMPIISAVFLTLRTKTATAP